MPVRVHKIIEAFLSDVTLVIPEQADGCIHIREMLRDNPDGLVRRMVACLGEHDEAIVARDATFLTRDDAEVLPGIRLGKYWDELSDASRDTVWKYLNLMLLAGAKHVRALDRNKRETAPTAGLSGEGLSGEDIASAIAGRLRDPEVRDKAMAIIREAMESIPDEDDDDVNPMERLKAVESLVNDLKGTQLGRIVEEVASDLSGFISPESLGLPPEADLTKMKPQDLIGLLAKPGLMKKVMAMVSKIGDNLNKRMESGEIDKDLLAKEGQEVIAKSQNLLKSLSPQAAKMLAAMQSGNGKMSARKLARAMEGKDLVSLLSGGGGGDSRATSTRERLRRKLAERKKTQEQDESTEDNARETMHDPSKTVPSSSGNRRKKKGAKKKDKKHQ